LKIEEQKVILQESNFLIIVTIEENSREILSIRRNYEAADVKKK
jgi:hypothetical protein